MDNVRVFFFFLTAGILYSERTKKHNDTVHMECAEYARPSRRPLGGILLRDKPLKKVLGGWVREFRLACIFFFAHRLCRIFILQVHDLFFMPFSLQEYFSGPFFLVWIFSPFSRPSPPLPHHFSNGLSVPNCRHLVQVIWRIGLKSPPPKIQRVSETCHEVRCVFFFVFKGDQGPAGLTGPAVSRDTSRQLIVVVLRCPRN